MSSAGELMLATPEPAGRDNILSLVLEILNEHMSVNIVGKSGYEINRNGFVRVRSYSGTFHKQKIGSTSHIGSPPPPKQSPWDLTQSDHEVVRKSSTSHLSNPSRNWWELWYQCRGTWNPDSRKSAVPLFEITIRSSGTESDTEESSGSEGDLGDTTQQKQGGRPDKPLFAKKSDFEKLDAAIEERNAKIRSLELLLKRAQTMTGGNRNELPLQIKYKDRTPSTTSILEIRKAAFIQRRQYVALRHSRLLSKNFQNPLYRKSYVSETNSEVSHIEVSSSDSEAFKPDTGLGQVIRNESLMFNKHMDFAAAGNQPAQNFHNPQRIQNSGGFRRFVPNALINFWKKTNANPGRKIDHTTREFDHTRKSSIFRNMVPSNWKKIGFSRGMKVSPMPSNPISSDRHC